MQKFIKITCVSCPKRGKMSKSTEIIQLHRTRKYVAGAVLIFLLIGLAVTIFYIMSRSLTKEEFVSRVQSCRSGAYLGHVDGSIVKYETKNCVVSKEVTHIGDGEPDEIKVLFEGKRMVCEYRKGEFNFDNIDYIMADIDSCNGDLKDILLELRGFTLGKLRSA
jgi:hypothetical protein